MPDSKLNERAHAPYGAKDDMRYTYADYASWDDDKRWELIDGVPYAMSAPNVAHQSICMELSAQLSIFLRGKPCRVFASPFDVRLNADSADDIVVKPDIVVICDSTKIRDGKSCQGAPDLVIEILSPSTARFDRFLKLNRYLAAGVREYWIVDPDTRLIETYILEGGKYSVERYSEEDDLSVHVLPGLVIDLGDVFTDV